MMVPPPTIRRLALVISLLAAIGSACVRDSSDSGLNVLLVVMDTTRADHLGVYGWERDTTPFLDSLAQRGVVFENLISPAATTPPSLASMLTGVLPFEHKVRAIKTLEDKTVDPAYATVAEILDARGFETAGFVSAVTASSRYGLDRGFDVWEERDALAAGQISAADVNAGLLGWLRNRPAGRPFFALAHYFDVHDLRLAAPQPYLDAFIEPGMSPREERIARYDGELRYLDSQLAEIWHTLVELGLDDSTAVLVVADHGEGLGDHGHQGHGLLYQEQIRVPLIAKVPGAREGARVQQRLSALSLAPTLLDLAGVPEDERPADPRGASLRAWLFDGEGPTPDLIFAESHNILLNRPKPQSDRGEIYAAIRGPWKYLYYPRMNRGELYNLDLDPREENDLAAAEPQIVAELHRALKRLGIVSPLNGLAPELSPRRREQLRALGYL